MRLPNINDGFWPVALTAFNADLSIDAHGQRKLLEHYSNNGASGIFINCLSSEIQELTTQEQIRLAILSKKHMPDGYPLISGAISTASNAKQIEFIKAIYDTGVDAVILAPSQFVASESKEDSLKSMLDHVMTNTPDIPLGIYECPYPYHRRLSPSMMAWLAETNRFVFHKDTCCDIDVLKLKIKACEHSPLKIFNAHLATLVESIKLGASGYSGIDGNFVTRIFSNLSSDLDTTKTQLKFCPKFEPILGDLYPKSAKCFLKLEGVPIESHSRVDRAPVEASHHTILAALYEEAKQLQPDCEVSS